MNKLTIAALIALSISCVTPVWPAAPFGVTGLTPDSTTLAFKSLSWDRNATISLHCTQANGAQRIIGLTGINVDELPYRQLDSLDVEVVVQPDGPRYLIRFLDAGGKLLGVIGLNAGGRLKLLEAWTLSPGKILSQATAPQRSTVEVLLSSGSRQIKAKIDEPVGLVQAGGSWRLVIRAASIPGKADTKFQGTSSEEAPGFSVDYTVFVQTKP